MVLFWDLKFFDLMVRHHAGVVSENNKRGWNFANSHNIDMYDIVYIIMHAMVMSDKLYLHKKNVPWAEE